VARSRTRWPKVDPGPRILRVLSATRNPEGIFEAYFPNSTKPIETGKQLLILLLNSNFFFFLSVSFGFVLFFSFIFSELLISEWCCCLNRYCHIRDAAHHELAACCDYDWVGQCTALACKPKFCVDHHDANDSFSTSGCDAGI
jgi:hypothetical protein